jgi:hypothetical protein
MLNTASNLRQLLVKAKIQSIGLITASHLSARATMGLDLLEGQRGDVNLRRQENSARGGEASATARPIASYAKLASMGPPPRKDFAVHSQAGNRTNMTRDTGINVRQMFERKFGIPQVYTRDHFRPGTIINANHFEEAWNTNPTASYAETLVEGNDGEKICVKRRYLIVVAQNESCYTTVPIFTFQGNGLDRKEAKHEYVSVRDHKISAEGFMPMSDHSPLITRHLKDPVWIKAESTAWVAYPVSRQYFLPVTLTGRLDDASTARLITLYHRFMGVRTIAPTGPASASSTGKRGFEGAETGSVKSIKLTGSITGRSAVEQQRNAVERMFLTEANTWTVVGGGRNASKAKQADDPKDAAFYRR